MFTKFCFCAIATIISGDYDFLSVIITFPSGSVNGTEECTSITVNFDDLVELKEDFRVILALVTSGSSLGVRNNASTISLIDSNGKYVSVRLRISGSTKSLLPFSCNV